MGSTKPGKFSTYLQQQDAVHRVANEVEHVPLATGTVLYLLESLACTLNCGVDGHLFPRSGCWCYCC